jgi:hypothetical protein
MLYCDRCANPEYYPVQETKTKGCCEICHKYAGPCNFIADEELPFNNIISTPVSLAGFEMKELSGFPSGKRFDMIEPGTPHRIVSKDTIIFYRKASVVLANTSTGQRVEIMF